MRGSHALENFDTSNASPVGADRLLPDPRTRCTDIDAYAELSTRESRTAGVTAERLRVAGHEVIIGVGQPGVAATVMRPTLEAGVEALVVVPPAWLSV